MKIKLLLLTIMGSITIANAQYTVTDHDGNELNDGDILEFGEYGYGTSADYGFYVTNDNPTDVIYSRIEFVSATNTTGDHFELCYAGQCYTGIPIGFTAPAVPLVLPIGVGENTGPGNHFLNLDPGDGVAVLDYVFAFHQYEVDGVTEIGTPLTFTYRYNPTLGVNENSRVDLTIQSTLISSNLVLNVNEPVSMMVYDLRGRVVKQANFEVGSQTVNMSDLNSQAYILQFQNKTGATQTTKIIVQ